MRYRDRDHVDNQAVGDIVKLSYCKVLGSVGSLTKLLLTGIVLHSSSESSTIADLEICAKSCVFKRSLSTYVLFPGI